MRLTSVRCKICRLVFLFVCFLSWPFPSHVFDVSQNRCTTLENAATKIQTHLKKIAKNMWPIRLLTLRTFRYHSLVHTFAPTLNINRSFRFGLRQNHMSPIIRERAINFVTTAHYCWYHSLSLFKIISLIVFAFQRMKCLLYII